MSNVDKPLDSSMWRERPAGREVKPPPSPAEALAIWRSTGNLPKPERKAEANPEPRQSKQQVSHSDYKFPKKAQKYLPYAYASDEKHGLPRGTVAAVAHTESGWDIKAKSKAGAIGISQIMPGYHPTVDPYDPIASLDYSGEYLATLIKRFGLRGGLTAYNAGPGNYQKYLNGTRPLKKESREYADKVMKRMGKDESKAGSSIDKPLK